MVIFIQANVTNIHNEGASVLLIYAGKQLEFHTY